MRATFDRVSNRAKRELIAKFPPATHYAESRRAAQMAAYRPRLRPLDERGRAQVATLEQYGALVGPWDDLALPGIDEVKPLLSEHAKMLAAVGPDTPVDGDGSICLSRDDMLSDERLFQWGLQDEVLDLVEHHLGMPAYYFGALVRRDVADAKTVGVRQWHRDVEDERNLKILVWLNDVDDDGGPFTYVPLPRSRDAVRELRYVGGFVPDERMEAVVPRSEWVQAVGPQWTAVMADNCQILHRAKPPVARDRYSVTFSWSTREPRKVMPAAPWRSDQVAQATRGLGSRALQALPPAMFGR
ncbi:hypothetical protein [Nocardioides sp. CER19]|uniref:hypothetical protein n=1 Tax=Nocardioides sp. CER19 TaxID=3038538 RepID=UPI002448F3A6|nr:hypothetical protein [Nocardioides sp. CER19]MDH2414738.1 hypothetical protein [Nocardioides sp. CER19]